MVLRRLITVVGSAFAALLLTTTAAFAHICYNASRSDTGNQHAAQSQAHGSAAELLGVLNVVGCTSEADALQAQFEADQLNPADVVVNTKTVMAGGVVGTSHSTDGQGIDHLVGYEPLLHDAFECLEAATPGS